MCITFVQCWTNVEDVGPTLYKCYTNVLRLLGIDSMTDFNVNIRCLIIVAYYFVPLDMKGCI